MAARTRVCMCAGTKRKATSTRRWSWLLTTRLTVSVWVLMLLTASRACRASVATPRRNFATRRSLAEHMPTSMASTAPTSQDGDGPSSGPSPLLGEQSYLRQQNRTGLVTYEDSRAQLGFQQPESLLIRNWRDGPGSSAHSLVAGENRMECRHRGDRR